MIVTSSSGKEIPITIIKDWALIPMSPLFLYNTLCELVLFKIINLTRMLVLTPANLFLSCISIFSLVNIPLILAFNLLIMALYPFINLEGSESTSIHIFYGSLLFLSSTVCAQSLIIGHERPFVSALLFGFSDIRVGRAKYNPNYVAPVPSGLRMNRYSKIKFYTALLITVYIVINFCIIAFNPQESIIYWNGVLVLFLMFHGVDPEALEHVASHSPRGRIARLETIRPASAIIYVVEWIRRNIVWPMLGMFPDMYYLTHACHHHVENNGPADWQSLQRFDKSSFLDFTKAICWFSISSIIPVDTLRYFWAQKKYDLFKRAIISSLKGYVVIASLFYLSPFFGIYWLAIVLGSGFGGYKFTFRWHGLHYSSLPYNVEASNNSPAHYAHHKRPVVHLYDSKLLKNIVDEGRIKYKQNLSFFKVDNDGENLLEKYWLIIHCMLWQKKYSCIRKLIDCDEREDVELKKYVEGSLFLRRRYSVEKLDSLVSRNVGIYIENILKFSNGLLTGGKSLYSDTKLSG